MADSNIVDEEVLTSKEESTDIIEKVNVKNDDQFENITVFGNKSLHELHSIQSKRSHLSAGTIVIIWSNLISSNILYRNLLL